MTGAAREIDQDVEVRARLAEGQHRLLVELIPTLRAPEDTLLLRPRGGRQDHVGELGGAGRVVDFSDHNKGVI